MFSVENNWLRVVKAAAVGIRERNGTERWRSESVTKQQLDDKLSEANGWEEEASESTHQPREVCLGIKSFLFFGSRHEIAEEVGAGRCCLAMCTFAIEKCNNKCSGATAEMER